MILSIDRINAVAPYKVMVEGDTSVLFITDFGVTYSVGFAEDYSFMPSGAYQFYIANIEHIVSPNDQKVRLTVQAIIEEFFRQEPSVMLYICDTIDHRQGVRNRLFFHWFEEYPKKNQLSLTNENVCFDDVLYYISMLIKRDHPQFNEIQSNFVDFIARLPKKIEELQM